MRKDFAEIHPWLESMTDEQLGKLVKEYVAEADHSSWEGFSSHDQTGIRRLFFDMMIYQVTQNG